MFTASRFIIRQSAAVWDLSGVGAVGASGFIEGTVGGAFDEEVGTAGRGGAGGSEAELAYRA